MEPFGDACAAVNASYHHMASDIRCHHPEWPCILEPTAALGTVLVRETPQQRLEGRRARWRRWIGEDTFRATPDSFWLLRPGQPWV